MSKKVVIITGASSGIGKATALHLIEEGYVVYAGARRVEKMKDIIEAGGKAMGLDVTDTKSIKKFVDKVIKDEGRIDVLFNNAGYGLYGAVEDIEVDRAREQFEVNIFGLAEMTKAVLPTMRKQKSGKIINTSSMGGKVYTPLGAWYHATKHALEGWSDCLRLELKQFGIDVVIIEPGVIQTDFGNVMGDQLLRSSENGTGAYEQISKKLGQSYQRNYENQKNGTPALVIAQEVGKAIKARKPKTRYVAGQYARPMMLIRKWLGDWVFDQIALQMVK